jgi:hypothetical protein
MMQELISLLTRKSSDGNSRLDRFAAGMFLVVLGSGVLLAAWMLFQNAAQKAVIHELAVATRDGDIHKLKSQTDWESVKESLKKDLKERGVTLASKTGDNDKAVDELVDFYVRPESLPSLLYYYNVSLGHVNPEAFVRDVRFSGITEMTIEIAPPPQLDKPWMNSLEPVRAKFALDGLEWKLKQLDAPDYLIPPKAPTPSFKDKNG